MKTFRFAIPDAKHESPLGMLGVWNKLISCISGEFLLDKRDNGGAIIALRSLLCSATLFSLAMIFRYFSIGEKNDVLLTYLLEGFAEQIAWFGAVFGAIYAALYTRFSSQWSYMANLYNQIKQASLSECENKSSLAEWKAGFIEDAEYLHLAHKENFISIIQAWMEQPGVKEAYVKYTPGGEVRWDRLRNGVQKRYSEIVNERGSPKDHK